MTTKRASRPRVRTVVALAPPSTHTGGDELEHSQVRELMKEDVFDRMQDDVDIARTVATFAARTNTPYTELVRRMLGMHCGEVEARAFFAAVLEHRRALSKGLGRPVHVRVAALDLLSLRPPRSTRRLHSRPIVVTPLLLERVLEEASADAVTGLAQRAHFMSLLRHELHQRRRRSVVVAYVDLDGFKAVNDAHGHAAGDDVLRTFARVGRVVLRRGDTLARIGGDEFALLLVDVTTEEAEAAVARLRERFEELTIAFGTSFSIGLVRAQEGESAEQLLARADMAMYRDKRGRAGLR